MFMHLHHSFYVLLLSGLAACSGGGDHTDRTVTTLTILSGSAVEKARTSDLFSSVAVVALETNEEALLGKIVKADRREDGIYVADSRAMYKFNADGSLAKKMNRKGPGPEEYQAISDFEIVDGDTFWVLSHASQLLYKFNWDGELLQRIQLNCWASKMHLLSAELMCLYIGNEMDEDNQHQLRTIDLTTGETVSRYKEINEKEANYLHVLPSNRFSPAPDNGLYYFNVYCDSIYELREGVFSTAYYVNIRNKNIPASFFDEDFADIREFSQTVFQRDFTYGRDLFVEYGDAWLFAYVYNQTSHYTFIGKDTRESFIDFTTLVEDVALSGYPINLGKASPFIQRNRDLIFPIQPFDLLQYAADSQMSAGDIATLRQRLNLTVDDQNPLLLILKR
jgi:hypothetical protein